jgi:hypothetical protein
MAEEQTCDDDLLTIFAMLHTHYAVHFPQGL